MAQAFRRAGLPAEYSMLSVETEYARFAEKLGVPLAMVPPEDEDVLSPRRFRDSELFAAIRAADPDVLIVDLHWFALDAFIRELPCRKVILIRRVDPRYFRFRTPNRELAFRPADYDIVVRIEPGFRLPFPSDSVEPIVLRNRDEILSRRAARTDLGLSEGARACLFAFSGTVGQGEETWKSFSYLEDEGWTVVRSDNRNEGLFPVVDWFAAFDLVVCGAGYNAFWEARYFRKEAFFSPCRTLFEDARERVATCSDYEFEENGADQLVRRVLSL